MMLLMMLLMMRVVRQSLLPCHESLLPGGVARKQRLMKPLAIVADDDEAALHDADALRDADAGKVKTIAVHLAESLASFELLFEPFSSFSSL
jgi:hypothetical protein